MTSPGAMIVARTKKEPKGSGKRKQQALEHVEHLVKQARHVGPHAAALECNLTAPTETTTRFALGLSDGGRRATFWKCRGRVARNCLEKIPLNLQDFIYCCGLGNCLDFSGPGPCLPWSMTILLHPTLVTSMVASVLCAAVHLGLKQRPIEQACGRANLIWPKCSQSNLMGVQHDQRCSCTALAGVQMDNSGAQSSRHDHAHVNTRALCVNGTFCCCIILLRPHLRST